MNYNENTYRNNGAVGALLDEYERAIKDLKLVLQSITHHELVTIVDAETKDDDCRSIQTILAHVVRAGYGYAIEVRNKQGEKLERPDRAYLESAEAFIIALDKMFVFNVTCLAVNNHQAAVLTFFCGVLCN